VWSGPVTCMRMVSHGVGTGVGYASVVWSGPVTCMRKVSYGAGKGVGLCIRCVEWSCYVHA
jgi:hypothetical protein